MTASYRAMQITVPGRLELVERSVPTPGAGQVLIAVEACGICGADRNDIENAPAQQPPRVPSHEVVGRITALGPGGPSSWSIGQRVGVGRKGGPCLECRQCRAGRFRLCPNQPIVGASCDGGYAEMMIARATGLVLIPDELSSEEAAPILCAGITTFNALNKCGAEAGDTVAVFGIGGLGHMALQYARRMGFPRHRHRPRARQVRSRRQVAGGDGNRRSCRRSYCNYCCLFSMLAVPVIPQRAMKGLLIKADIESAFHAAPPR